MRIAMIGSRGIPAATGGVEHVVEELSAELIALGHEVLVYARPGYLRRGAGGRRVSARVIATPGLGGKHTEAITHTATAMWDVLRRKVDLVHIHAAGPALLSPVAAAAKLPVALTVHAPDWQRRRWSAGARAALRAGLALGMRFATAVSAVSLSLRNSLADTYHREVVWIPNGVRPAQPAGPSAVAAWGLKGEAYALHVGRIVPEKRLDLLLVAWREIRPGMPLAVVGDAEQDPRYAARCRELADESVRFLGPVYGEPLAGLYSNAAVVVQPSELEGMSLVLLEAASHARCIVARDIPANREALGEAMAAFAGDDAGNLGGAIMKCVQDREYRQRLGRTARRRVIEKFAWPEVARQYERMYLCALKTQVPAPGP